MTLASIRAWFGRFKVGLYRSWRRLLPRLRQWGSVAWSCFRGLTRNVLSWNGQGWLVVVTIVLAVLGYWQWRYNNVLQLQARWASAEMLVRHERLFDALNCRFIPAYVEPDQDQRVDPVEHMAFSSSDYIGIEADLTAYLEFFGEVEMCVDTSLCDPSVACRRFAPPAQALQFSYRPTLDQLRRVTGNSTFGREFERVGQLCQGYWDPPAPPVSRDRTRAEEDEVERVRDQLIGNSGAADSRRDQACARMNPALLQSQSGPNQ